MAWTAPRTWVVGEVLTAALLNTHLRDNLLESGPAKASAAGDVLYATAANALAVLGASADELVGWNSGGSALEAKGKPGLRLQASNTTEQSASFTGATDLLTFSGLSIPATDPILIVGVARAYGGNGNNDLGLKLNSTIVAEADRAGNVPVWRGNDLDGGFFVLVPPRVSNYLSANIGLYSTDGNPTAVTEPSKTADNPSATITSVTIRGNPISGDTIYVKDCHVYSMGAD